MIKMKKEKPPVEESLFLRMLWLAQTFTCFYLIALVDNNIATVNFFDLKIPLLFINFWTAVCGCYLSYHFRHQSVKWLEYVGLVTIAITCNWFIEVMRMQLNSYSGTGVDLLLPTVHLFAGLYVSHSFELRSRFDFNFSQGVSLLLVCFTSTLGKGGWFGLGMLIYLVLAATLLLLDCESRTFGQVQSRAIDGSDSYTAIRGGKPNTEKTANLVFPTVVLLSLSICLFLLIPRAESFADMIAAQVYALGRKDINPNVTKAMRETNKRIRSPFHVKPPFEQPAEKPVENKPDSNKNKDKDSPENKDKGKDVSTKSSGKGGNSGKGAGKQDKDEEAKKDSEKHELYSRKAEKEKRENAARELAAASNRAQDEIQSSDPASQGRSESKGTTDSKGAAGKGSGGSDQAQNQQVGTGSPAKGDKPNPDGLSGTGKGKKGGEKFAGDKGPKQAGGKKNGKPDDPAAPKEKIAGKGGDDKKEKEKSPYKQGPEQADPKAKNKNGDDVFYMPDQMEASTPSAGGDELLFRVTCNRTVPLKQGAFDYYDGKHWNISSDIPKVTFQKAQDNTYTLKNVFPIALQQSVPAIKLKQSFHMMKNLGTKIIFAGFPTYIEYPCSTITVDSAGNLKGSGVLLKGLDYTVISDEALYDIQAMVEEPVPSDESEQSTRKSLALFLQIPEDQSEQLYELSKQVAGLEDNWFVQAEKISQYLRKNYNYSKEATRSKKSERNSVDRFLFESKKGDCKDFASSFVILCRASGIPARMVVGFTPGDFDPASGAREVRLKNSHAWGEVYIPEAGWIPFDSTPVSNMPARAGEEERYFKTIGQKISNSQVGQTAAGNAVSIPIGSSKTVTFTILDLLKLLPVGLVVIVISGPFMMFFRDLRKLSWTKMHPAGKIYSGVQKDMRKIGVKSVESETPGEFLQNVQEIVADWEEQDRSTMLVNAVEDFVESYNATYFGGEGNVKDLEKKRQQIKELIKR